MTPRLPHLLILPALVLLFGAAQASAASLPADSTAVLVKNRTTGQVVLVSREVGADGEPAHDNCSGGAVSDDGKRVAFVCDGPLDTADTNLQRDVYVRDITTDATFLASRADQEGVVGTNPSFDPALSADGRFVAFSSQAKNIDPDAQSGSLLRFTRTGKGRRYTKALRKSARRGTNRIRLNGRIGKRVLPAGRYRLTLTVRDAAGNNSKSVVRRLTVTRGKSR